MVDRTSRDLETREAEVRPASWRPPSILPDPKPIPGWVFRWIRTSTLGQSDNTHVSASLREGWEPVRAEDHPELKLYADKAGRFPDAVEVGGLVLCKMPEEIAKQRNAYYAKMAAAQMESVDNSFMRENDPRMPLFKERSSKVTFGRGPGG